MSAWLVELVWAGAFRGSRLSTEYEAVGCDDRRRSKTSLFRPVGKVEHGHGEPCPQTASRRQPQVLSVSVSCGSKARLFGLASTGRRKRPTSSRARAASRWRIAAVWSRSESSPIDRPMKRSPGQSNASRTSPPPRGLWAATTFLSSSLGAARTSRRHCLAARSTVCLGVARLRTHQRGESDTSRGTCRS